MHRSIFIKLSISTMVGTVLATSTSALALSVFDTEQPLGWSGSTSLFIINSDGESTQRYAMDDKAPVIDSLTASPPKYDVSTIIPTIQVHYNTSQSIRFSLNIFETGFSNNTLIENQSLLAFSAHKTFRDDSEIWASISPNVPGLYQTWEDPYLTGSPLQKTDASLNGFAFGANYIFGSPFSISSSIGEHTINKDNSGIALGSQLDATELKQLRRDTSFSDTRLSALLPFNQYLFLESGIRYFQSDATGAANRFNAKGFDIKLAYLTDKLDVYVSTGLDHINFAKPNPVFKQKRKEDSYNITAGLSYKAPFSWQGISADIFISTSEKNSNIRFYEEKDTSLAIGMTYDF